MYREPSNASMRILRHNPLPPQWRQNAHHGHPADSVHVVRFIRVI